MNLNFPRIFWFFFTLIVIFIIILFHRPLLELPADYLIIKNPQLQPAQAAIVLSGEVGERIDYAVQLYMKGLVKYLIISGDTPGFTGNQMRDLALMQGIPKNKIIVETNSTSTLENALFTRKIMLDKNWPDAIVVTSPYHSRRAAWVFKKVFRDGKIKLQICYSPLSWFVKENWWKKSYHRLILKREYERLFWYYLYYGLLNKKS